MPVMEIIRKSPVVKSMNLETAFCRVGRTMKTLSVKKQPDGSVAVFMTENENNILFSLDKHQAAQVIDLLLNTGPKSVNRSGNDRQIKGDR